MAKEGASGRMSGRVFAGFAGRQGETTHVRPSFSTLMPFSPCITSFSQGPCASEGSQPSLYAPSPPPPHPPPPVQLSNGQKHLITAAVNPCEGAVTAFFAVDIVPFVNSCTHDPRTPTPSATLPPSERSQTAGAEGNNHNWTGLV